MIKYRSYRRVARDAKQAAKLARKRLLTAAPDLLAACRAVAAYEPGARQKVLWAIETATGTTYKDVPPDA